MIVLKKGAYNYHATCHTCHTEAITNLPINRICPNCGDLMVVFGLQKPLKMAFVEAYDYKSNQRRRMKNIANILKHYPSGTKLYSPLCGECVLIEINRESNIVVKVSTEEFYYTFFHDGRYCKNGDCLLFPSKNCTDWNTMNIHNKGGEE